MTSYPQLGASAQPSTNFDLSPILVFGSSPSARDRAIRAVSASGYRLGDALAVDQGLARLDAQGSASAVWIELDRDDGNTLDLLIERVDRDATAGRYAAIVATSDELIDRVDARIAGRDVELLVNADDVERTAALALALTRVRSVPDPTLADMARDNSAARLRQLSDEVGRIAATLATLSKGPVTNLSDGAGGLDGGVSASGPSAAPLPDVSRDHLRAVIRARRVRSRFFAEDLFADPAWDMLLDLMQAELAQMRVPVSSLCIAAAVPATTALRWLKTLTDRGLIVRRADPHDGRRVFVELSNDASASIRRYFGEVGQVVGV